MADPTESFRREAVHEINAAVESDSREDERSRLEKEHGQVWNTAELSQDFTCEGFMAPFVVCTKKDTGEKGALQFQHNPRFYFGWQTV